MPHALAFAREETVLNVEVTEVARREAKESRRGEEEEEEREEEERRKAASTTTSGNMSHIRTPYEKCKIESREEKRSYVSPAH